MGKSVRVWRYRADQGKWEYRPKTGAPSWIDPENAVPGETIRLPLTAGASPSIQDAAWLFEDRLDDAVPTKLDARLIRAIVPDDQVPATATVWCYSEEKERFKRIYRRTNAAANVSTAPPHVQALGDLCADGDVVLDCGEDEAPIHLEFMGGNARLNAVEVESVSGSVAEVVDPGGPGGVELFCALVAEIDGNGQDIRVAITRAGDALRAKDDGAFEAAAKFLFETMVTGPTPGPTQGTNVLHQLTTAIDDLTKLRDVIRIEANGQGINGVSFQGASSDASGYALGGEATSFGSVDMTWQALASVVSMTLDVLSLYRMCRDWENPMPDEQRVDLDKMVKGRGLTLSSNVLKSYSTVTGSVHLISQVATSASILSVGLATSIPVVGSVTGLATMVRSTWQAEKSRKRARHLRELRRIMQSDRGDLEKETQELLAFAMGKAVRKHRFKATEATVGAASAGAGTCLAIGAVAAGANFWNPIGWGLGAAVIVAGTGMLSYKIYRKARSSHRAKKRGFKSADYPRTLVVAYVKAHKAGTRLDKLILGGILESYGVEPAWLQMNTPQEALKAQQQVASAINRVQRHVA